MMWRQPIHWAFGHAYQRQTRVCCGVPKMKTRSRSISTTDPYGAQAEQAARLAEGNFREAAARRAAEIEERERAVAAREQLIRALENRLEESRRRLEERLQQVKDYRPLAGGYRPEFRVPSIDEGYFDAGSNVDEDAWWSRQLGKSPVLAA
jgi:hypothetical protein